MSNKTDIDIDALIQEETPITEAIRRGSLEAMKRHIMAGQSMVSYKDGQVIHIPVEELSKMLADMDS
jgi:hypothetical protein